MAKKFLTLAFAFISMAFIWFVNSKPLFNNLGDGYEVYLKSNSSKAQIVSVLKSNLWLYPQRYGEACVIKDNNLAEKNPLDYIQNFGGKLIFSEQTEQGISYYGYSPRIKYAKILNGKKINLHLFVGENYSKIGSPIIYGSY
jgi:hypothetical protein